MRCTVDPRYACGPIGCDVYGCWRARARWWDRLYMTNRLLRWFDYQHLPENLQPISHECAKLADIVDDTIPECAEKTAGLRKLLEAKDCFVRAVIESKQ